MFQSNFRRFCPATEKNVPLIYSARAPWYFGALFLFFVLFHATRHTLAKWGGQSDNSKFWLNLLYWNGAGTEPKRRSVERTEPESGRSEVVLKEGKGTEQGTEEGTVSQLKSH